MQTSLFKIGAALISSTATSMGGPRQLPKHPISVVASGPTIPTKIAQILHVQRARCERTMDFALAHALAHIRLLSEILLNQVTHHL